MHCNITYSIQLVRCRRCLVDLSSYIKYTIYVHSPSIETSTTVFLCRYFIRKYFPMQYLMHVWLFLFGKYLDTLFFTINIVFSVTLANHESPSCGSCRIQWSRRKSIKPRPYVRVFSQILLQLTQTAHQSSADSKQWILGCFLLTALSVHCYVGDRGRRECVS